MEGAYLAHAVYGFFQNGGGLCWVVRVGADADGRATPQAALPAAGDRQHRGVPRRRRATASTGDVDARARAEEPASAEERRRRRTRAATYKIVVTAGAAARGVRRPDAQEGPHVHRHQGQRRSKLIKIEETGAALPDGAARRGQVHARVPAGRAGATSTPSDFEGDVARREGMGGLAAIDEITMVCVPDLMTLAGRRRRRQLRDLQGKMIAHCETPATAWRSSTAPPDLIPQDVLEWRKNTAGYDSKFADALLAVARGHGPAHAAGRCMVPPSGHVAGVWARTDTTRGVHKAPANEVVLGVNGARPSRSPTTSRAALNQTGINCIRAFPGRGIRIWGARTLSSDPEWRYLNVRRLFNYVSESIMEGTQWAVFEPNDERLWIRLRIAVVELPHAHLARAARCSARRPSEAFFVKCDAETNPPDVIEAGQVVVRDRHRARSSRPSSWSSGSASSPPARAEVWP